MAHALRVIPTVYLLEWLLCIVNIAINMDPNSERTSSYRTQRHGKHVVFLATYCFINLLDYADL